MRLLKKKGIGLVGIAAGEPFFYPLWFETKKEAKEQIKNGKLKGVSIELLDRYIFLVPIEIKSTIRNKLKGV